MNEAKQPAPDVIRLTDEERAALQEIAERTGSRAERGPTAGRPSWRVLVKRIANGELIVRPSGR